MRWRRYAPSGCAILFRKRESEATMAETNRYDISYGKARVPVYRIYARPLVGITPIPESSFTGRENTLFALEVDVEVFGDNFLSSYTEGDNTSVVATDSMKTLCFGRHLPTRAQPSKAFLICLATHFWIH